MDTHFLQEKEEKTEAQDFKQLPQRHTDRKSRARHQTLSLRHYRLCLAQSKFTQWSRKCKCVLSHSVTSSSLWPRGLQPTRLLCPWDSPAKNTGVGCHALVPGISTTQESNPGLPHCRWILYCLSHQEAQKMPVLCLVIQSCSALCNPMDLQPTRLLCPWGFSRQKYWSGLPCPRSRDLPNPGIKPKSPALQVDFFLQPEPPEKVRGGSTENVPGLREGKEGHSISALCPGLEHRVEQSGRAPPPSIHGAPISARHVCSWGAGGPEGQEDKRMQVYGPGQEGSPGDVCPREPPGPQEKQPSPGRREGDPELPGSPTICHHGSPHSAQQPPPAPTGRMPRHSATPSLKTISRS